APFPAVEDAIVADIPGEEILLLRLGQPGCDVERRLGLADARNIVSFAFDREEGGVPDRVRTNQPSAMLHLALRQLMLLEDDVDRLQIELRGHVADRAIFLVE